MIRAVLDTNILVSNLLSSGPARSIVGVVGTRFHLVLSAAILLEVEDVLKRPRIATRIALTDAERVGYVNALLAISDEIVPGLVVVPDFDPDPKDTHLLACAIESHADYLVTGDASVLNLGSYHATKIITPRAFLDLIA